MRVDPFFIDEAPVTNKEYAKFVRATYYETEAEKFGWSFVLCSFVPNAEELEFAEVDPEAVGAPHPRVIATERCSGVDVEGAALTFCIARLLSSPHRTTGWLSTKPTGATPRARALPTNIASTTPLFTSLTGMLPSTANGSANDFPVNANGKQVGRRLGRTEKHQCIARLLTTDTS